MVASSAKVHDLGFKRWCDEGRQIVEDGRQIGDNASANQWQIGDWWNAGERYGERTQTAKELGLKPTTCRNLGWVANAFNVSLRRDTLSFDHHKTVSGLDQAERDSLLNWCLSSNGSRQTVAQLRAEIKRRHPSPPGSGGKKGGKSKEARRDDDSSSAHIRVWVLEQFKAGKAPTETSVADAFGLARGDKAVQLGFYEARGAWFERIEPEIDPASLPKTTQKKLDSAVKQMALRTAAANRVWQRAETENIIKRLKAESFPTWAKDAEEAGKDRERYRKLANSQKQPPLTDAEWKLLQLCIGGNPTPETRNDAAVLLVNKRFDLTGTKDKPRVS